MRRQPGHMMIWTWMLLWEYDGNEDEYMDASEGVGIEGDLDVEDDE